MPDPQAWTAPDLSAAPGAPAGPHGFGDGPGASGAPGPSADRGELLGGAIPLRPLGVSETLDAAITAIRRSPRAVLGMTLAIISAVEILLSLVDYFLIGDTTRGGATPAEVLRALGGPGLLSLTSSIITAYVILLLSGLLAPLLGRTLFGLPAVPGQAWRDVRGGLPGGRGPLRVLGAATAVLGLSLLAAVLPTVPFLLLVIGGGPVPLAVLAGIVGFPAGFVLMFWLYVRYVLAVPAVVLERGTLPAALGRAARLVRGRWWRTCGVLLLTLLITVFMSTVLRVPFAVLTAIVTSVSGNDPNRVVVIAIGAVGRILSAALTSPFDAGVIALLYIDLRMRREGLDLDVQTRPDAEVRTDFLAVWRPS